MGQKKHNKVEFRLKSFAKINLSLNVLKKKMVFILLRNNFFYSIT